MKSDKDRSPESTKALPPGDEAGAFWSDCMYAAVENSSLFPSTLREAYDDAAPETLVCPFSFVTRADLENSARALGQLDGNTLLDLACGGGGPGLWVARATGADLLGIDYSQTAVQQAGRRAVSFGMKSRAHYCCASIRSTGLESAAFDAAICFDALWTIADKKAVLQEVKRLLRPGKRFVFTTWESRLASTTQSEEYRSILDENGLKIEIYQETADWERLQREVYSRWLSRQYDIALEMGVGPAGFLIQEAIWMTSKLDDGTDRLSHTRRIFVVCKSPVE